MVLNQKLLVSCIDSMENNFLDSWSLLQVLKTEGYFVTMINGDMSAAKRNAVSFGLFIPTNRFLGDEEALKWINFP